MSQKFAKISGQKFFFTKKSPFILKVANNFSPFVINLRKSENGFRENAKTNFYVSTLIRQGLLQVISLVRIRTR
jgi:hypothetical protein